MDWIFQPLRVFFVNSAYWKNTLSKEFVAGINQLLQYLP